RCLRRPDHHRLLRPRRDGERPETRRGRAGRNRRAGAGDDRAEAARRRRPEGDRRLTRRSAVGIAIAVAIAAAAFEPFYLRIFTIDRAAFRARLIELPYSKLPGSRRFLEGVRARTHDG